MFDKASLATSIAVVLAITSGAFASSTSRSDRHYHYTGAGPYGYAGVGPYGYAGAYGYAAANPYGYAGVGPYQYASQYGYGSGAILIQDRYNCTSSGLLYC